jgi:hypothetical protein
MMIDARPKLGRSLLPLALAKIKSKQNAIATVSGILSDIGFWSEGALKGTRPRAVVAMVTANETAVLPVSVIGVVGTVQVAATGSVPVQVSVTGPLNPIGVSWS